MPEELLTGSPHWNQIVRNLREVVRNETGRDRPIGFTEFNSHWSNAAGGATMPDSFLSPLWLGDVLARQVATPSTSPTLKISASSCLPFRQHIRILPASPSGDWVAKIRKTGKRSGNGSMAAAKSL